MLKMKKLECQHLYVFFSLFGKIPNSFSGIVRGRILCLIPVQWIPLPNEEFPVGIF